MCVMEVKKIKILILTTIPAPYRLDYFNELGKVCDLTVLFEANSEKTRHDDWFLLNFNNFRGIFIENGLIRSGLEIYKQIFKYPYDLYLAFEYSTRNAAIFMTSLILNKKKYLINCDGAFINAHSLKDQIKKFFISNATACLANGDHAKKYFRHFGASEERIHLHSFSSLYQKDIKENPISMEEKNKLRKKLNIDCEKLAIAVGRFIYSKGFDVLIKAWSKVSPDYQLIIIGGGEKETEYQDLIKNNNLKNIQLMDFKKSSELRQYYLAANLFVLPTREDVWGLVINEAMACGLPTITTDQCIAGLELIKDGENGYVVPVDRVDLLSRQIETVLSNNQLMVQMAEKNLRKIQPYTIESMVESHLKLFAEIGSISC